MSASNNTLDPFGAKTKLSTLGGDVQIYKLSALTDRGVGQIDKLPYCMRVLVESALRNLDGHAVTEADVRTLANWSAKGEEPKEIPFAPARVLLQDFTGVPAIVDLAAMRDAMTAMNGDPKKINPLVPVDLVIDHSVQVDAYASKDAARINVGKEFQRNRERYELLHWGKSAFDNFRVVPPATGIVHQVNLEYLASVVATRQINGETIAMPDSLVGTDSHTVMINGLGIVAWGVGGIEAEAVMLGQPIFMIMPEVIGFEMTSELPEGATATDLVLTVTEMLRQQGVVGKFVEFFGEGVSTMTAENRATIGNMAPEYGATMGFFPVDGETLSYLRRTGRPDDLVDLVERYSKEQGLFCTDDADAIEYSDTLKLDLSTIVPSLAGPKRPQDRVALSNMKQSFNESLRAPVDKRGFALAEDALSREASVQMNGTADKLKHGSVVIAAITSCTNTSNPNVMVAAGLVAKKACEKGLKVKPYVKTSLAPGSQVVTHYLDDAGLTPYLEEQGFHTVGYGCTTCIGNSGPLPEPVAVAIKEGDLVVSSVLSGNRNFEGRVHALVKANYLASPPLVVAYALAGTTDIDLSTEPIGTTDSGEAVYLKDIWPSQQEIADAIAQSLTPEQVRNTYQSVFKGSDEWNQITATPSDTYAWKASSTYIQNPPFFAGISADVDSIKPIKGARVLVMLGDSVTTDHISPAGAITPDSPAGRYLIENGVQQADFNSYGSRRGNDRVMTRGTFANIRLRNLLAPGTEGGITRFLPTGEQMSVYDASLKYIDAGTPLIVLAGTEYGTGSSRDWAAKGTKLLGVRAVIAESFERIHRSNLVGMGILPLQFKDGQNRKSLGLTGEEFFDIEKLSDDLKPGQDITITATDPINGESRPFVVQSRLDSTVEVNYYRNEGILHTVLRQLART